MNRTSNQTPWTVQWDEAFFRLVQSLFSPHWLDAASALLSSYDADESALVPR